MLDKLNEPGARNWYATQSLEHGWSRNVLAMQIDTHAYSRAGAAITNFDARLPPPQSDLAREALKDPYVFDFLGLTEDAQEPHIETALTRHITRFLLELGAGFAFVGRQYRLVVGGDEFLIDLLFYHLKLRSYVVVELKATPFRPEYADQLNFYLSADDAELKGRISRRSACSYVERRTDWSQSTHCAGWPIRWASRNTSFSVKCRRHSKRAYRRSIRSRPNSAPTCPTSNEDGVRDAWH